MCVEGNGRVFNSVRQVEQTTSFQTTPPAGSMPAVSVAPVLVIQ